MHEISTPYEQRVCCVRGICHDAQTDMLPGEPRSAICVQRFDDSLSSAIHITYRSWLRSSSMHEPRDPPLEVVSCFSYRAGRHTHTKSAPAAHQEIDEKVF